MPNPRAADNLTAHRFQPGQSGNPGGKTSTQRHAEVEAAEKAATRMNLLRLIKEAMD